MGKIYLKCDKCGKIWAYKGQNKVMATCPDCMKKVNISKCKITEQLYLNMKVEQNIKFKKQGA